MITVAVFEPAVPAAKIITRLELPFDVRDWSLRERTVREAINSEVRGMGRSVRTISAVIGQDFDFAVYLRSLTPEEKLRRKPVRRGGPQGGKIPGR